MSEKSLAFVGGGVMASAILASLDSKSGASVADPSADARKRHESAGLAACASPADLPEADAYFLCVKPQDMADACASLASGRDLAGVPVISIAAGVSVATLVGLLGGAQVVRTMPNTPLVAGKGFTFACGPDGSGSAAAQLARETFSAMGGFRWLENENLMHAATALSGSGPAYAYLVIEAMAAKGAEMGLDPALALEATLATVAGACAMVESAGETPGELRRKVTSKGGTTEAALGLLSDRGFADALTEAIEAARRRSEELSGS